MNRGKWIVALCALLQMGVAHGHLLNMTKVSIAPGSADQLAVVIDIDLGQSLMTADQYWLAASSKSAAEQLRYLAPALADLQQGLALLADDRPLQLKLTSHSLSAQSRESVANPLTPQMTRLDFVAQLPEGANLQTAQFKLNVSDKLSIPWPLLIRVERLAPSLPVSRLLTAQERNSRSFNFANTNDEVDTWIAGAAEQLQSWVTELGWIAIGFQHIIPRGLDHIVFVLGLFLLSPKLSTLLLQVSCFTVAHSVTLAMATTGLVNVPSSVVEPLIAASIVYIAFDNLQQDNQRLSRWRLPIITLFGLLHGFGFASALGNFVLPEEGYLSALLLFNVGVEIGQLAVLALAFITVGWLSRKRRYTERLVRPASLTIAGIGAFWLLKRVPLL